MPQCLSATTLVPQQLSAPPKFGGECPRKVVELANTKSEDKADVEVIGCCHVRSVGPRDP